MSKVCSIFSQMLQLISRAGFDAAVRRHQAERHARGFTSWGQFVAMLFCQLGGAKSLREICGGLAASEGKLRHLGLPEAPPRSYPPRRSRLCAPNTHFALELRTPLHQLFCNDWADW